MSISTLAAPSLSSTESNLAANRYVNNIRQDSITDISFPSMCDFVNCDVKSYSTNNISMILIINKYLNGRISSLNIFSKNNAVRTSCIRTSTEPIAKAHARRFFLRSIFESDTLGLKRYCISFFTENVFLAITFFLIDL